MLNSTLENEEMKPSESLPTSDESRKDTNFNEEEITKPSKKRKRIRKLTALAVLSGIAMLTLKRKKRRF